MACASIAAPASGPTRITMSSRTILTIEDDAAIRRGIVDALQFAGYRVIEAADGKVGSFIEQIYVSCLTFDPRTHAYTLPVMNAVKVLGAATVLALGLMVFVLWRRERSRLVEVAS